MRVLLFLMSALLVGCAHQPPATTVVPHGSNPTKEKNLFDLGFKALAKNDYKSAEQKFSDLINQYPSSHYLPHAEYNLGLALEGQKKYADAAVQYEKVSDYYEGNPGRDAAEAIYRLSVCYEVTNDDTKVVIALRQLKDLTSFLGRDIAEVELPARLAAAYARQGNATEARDYFSRSEQGLKRMRILHPKGDAALWMPKTFYSMGHLPPPKKDLSEPDFLNYVSALNQNQIWLVRSAEMGDNPWSQKAAEDLISIYFDAWDCISKHQVSSKADKLQIEKARQDEQRSMASALDASLGRLKLERLPSSPLEPETPRLTSVFNNLSGIQKKLDQFLLEPNVQDQNTEEAQKREGLKRQGVIKDK